MVASTGALFGMALNVIPHSKPELISLQQTSVINGRRLLKGASAPNDECQLKPESRARHQ